MAKLDHATGARGASKSPKALRTISEAADLLDVPQHVLRFWETKFSQIKPLKRNGGRRYYRPEDIEVLLQIKHLLYKQGYTIKGAKKAFETKTVPGIKETFSDVALGEPTTQHNDNGAAPHAKQAVAEHSIEEPKTAADQSSQILAVKDELIKLSSALRSKKI